LLDRTIISSYLTNVTCSCWYFLRRFHLVSGGTPKCWSLAICCSEISKCRRCKGIYWLPCI